MFSLASANSGTSRVSGYSYKTSRAKSFHLIYTTQSYDGLWLLLILSQRWRHSWITQLSIYYYLWIFRRDDKGWEMFWSSSETQSIHLAWMLEQEFYFSEMGSERYFLQLATFTVIMIHSHVHMSVFLALKTGCFVFYLSLITHGAISHRHPEMAHLHRILQVRGQPLAAKFSRDGRTDGDGVIHGLMQDQKWEISVLLWAQGWKYTNLLVTTSSGRPSVPGKKHTERNEHFLSIYCGVQRSSADWLTDLTPGTPVSNLICEIKRWWVAHCQASCSPLFPAIMLS